MNQVLDSSKVGAVGEFIKDNTKKMQKYQFLHQFLRYMLLMN